MTKTFALALAVILLGCVHASPADPVQLDCDLVAAAAVPTDVHYTTVGYQRSSSAAPGCVESGISHSLPYIDRTKRPQGPVTFKFAVLADGRPAGFEVMTPRVEREFACAVWQAISRCSWNPGRDPGGRPASTWRILPLAVK